MKIINKIIFFTVIWHAQISWAEIHLGGYGELHYNNLQSGNIENADNKDKEEIDFHRFVLEVGKDFNDKVRFFSEVEIEHALVSDNNECEFQVPEAGLTSGQTIECEGGESPGEVELEQAYVEIDLNENNSLVTGVFLIPVGILNETHEPSVFYGVERNPVEKDIIPTTWWEAGVKYSGHNENSFSYDVAIHSGLERADGNIRKGRQKAAKANANALAYTGRLKYTGIAGLELAVTLHKQHDMSQGAVVEKVAADLVEAHGIYSTGKFKFLALLASWDVDVHTAREKQKGSVLEASYRESEKLGVFIRSSVWSNDDELTKKRQQNAGFNYWPHEDVVFKVDMQRQNSDAGDWDGFNMGAGYRF